MTDRLPDHAVNIKWTGDNVALEFSPTFNVASAFIDRHIVEGRGERVAIMSTNGNVTYSELGANVERAGNVLLELGLVPGQRVLIIMKDTPTFLYTFWGAIRAGLISIPVSTMMKAEEYKYLIENSECSAVIFSDDIDEARIAVAGLNSLLAIHDSAFIEKMSGASRSLAPAPTGPLDDCFWLYSSGSTGRPKGVVHRHRDMVVTSECYGKRVAGLTCDDIVFCASKLFFSYGFGGGMTFPLWAGAATVLSEERPSAEMAFAMIEAFRPSYYFGVPTLYGQMLAVMEQSPYDLSSIRGASSAGEALPAHIFHKWKETTGISILDGIGSTEVLHIFVSNRHADQRPGTSGKPVPGYIVKIVDEDGAELPSGEVGTLWVKGMSNARCYWKAPEKTSETMRGEWINTGDMYFIDLDGYYVNVGRGDDMFKVGGMWCSPIEIEAHLLTHPEVREVAVVGKTDSDNLMKPAAYVVLKESADAGDALRTELIQFCKAGLARYKYPRWITFMDQLPKTATGKIRRFELRQVEIEPLPDTGDRACEIDSTLLRSQHG